MKSIIIYLCCIPVGLLVFFVLYFIFSLPQSNPVYVPLTEEELVGGLAFRVGTAAIVACLVSYFLAVGVEKKLAVKP